MPCLPTLVVPRPPTACPSCTQVEYLAWVSNKDAAALVSICQVGFPGGGMGAAATMHLWRRPCTLATNRARAGLLCFFALSPV